MKIPDLKYWRKYSSKSPAAIDGTVYPFLSAEFYEKEINGVLWSCGVFSVGGEVVLKAWGEKLAPHCGMHAIWEKGAWTTPIPGCPEHIPIIKNSKIEALQLSFHGKTRIILPHPNT